MIRSSGISLIKAAIAIALTATDVLAQATERSLAETPQATIGATFDLPNATCVDPGGAGFVCVKFVGPALLEIRGDYLSIGTPQAIAELLVRTCRGTAQLDNAACRMRVSGRVRSAESRIVEGARGSFPFIRIGIEAIDLRR